MAYRFTDAGFLDTVVPGFTAGMEACWSAETSNDCDRWRGAVRGLGQCAVTALIVQEHFGGELMRGEFGGGSHYWNRLPNGTEVDLTASQFEQVPDFTNVVIRSRDYVLSYPATVRRYEMLKSRFQAAIDAPTLAVA